MGEGITIGLDAMSRAEIVGTEMKGQAGSNSYFNFDNQPFGYSLVLQRLYHIDGTPREKYIPKNYVSQSTNQNDETLEKGIEVVNKMME